MESRTIDWEAALLLLLLLLSPADRCCVPLTHYRTALRRRNKNFLL